MDWAHLYIHLVYSGGGLVVGVIGTLTYAKVRGYEIRKPYHKWKNGTHKHRVAT